MATKKTYKIPNSINVTKFDMPLSMRVGTVGAKRPRTLGLLMFVMAAVIVYFYIVYSMLSHEFGILSGITFSIGYIWICTLALKRQRTGEYGYKYFGPTLLYFMNFKRRFIKTRGSAGEQEMARLQDYITVEEIDKETGLIHYINGDVAYAFDLVGYGSRALFDEERDRIISAFESVLKSLDVGVSINVDFKQDSHDCSEQKDNLENKRKNNNKPTIDLIATRRIEVLNTIENNFQTTHQTMYLRAPSEDLLNTAVQKLLIQKDNGLLRIMDTIVGQKLYDQLKSFYSMS